MPAANFDITVTCGRDFYLSIVNQATVNQFNLSGYIIYLTVKKAINDADSAALFSGTPWSADLSFGQLTFKIPHPTTSGWWKPTGPISTTAVYDVTYADLASPKNWNTVLSGTVALVQPILQLIPGG